MERVDKIQTQYEDMIRSRNFDPDFLDKNAFGYYMNEHCASLYDGWWEATKYYKKDISDLYYEAHITIEPVFDGERELAAGICKPYGFKLADLLMKKRSEDTEERSANDTFMTGHSKSYKDIAERTKECIIHLQKLGYKVWRYKIEDTLLDSRSEDVFGLLPKEEK